MVNQCRHIRTSGIQCGMAAMRSRNFCFYHQNCQPRPQRTAVRTRPHTQAPIQTYDYGAIPVAELASAPQIQPPVQLLFPEDRASIQINLYRIAVAQAENRIDTRTANSMTWNQQVSMANLSRQPLIDAAPASARSASSSRDDDDSDSRDNSGCARSGFSDLGSRPISRVILTPDGDEIALPVEILEPNEAEPIHHRLCPCLLCAEKYRNQPPEEHHPACQCGLCEEQDSGCREQGSQRQGSGLREQGSESADLRTPTHNDVILSEARVACAVEGPASTEPATIQGSDNASTTTLFPEPCALSPAIKVESQSPDPAASSLAQQGPVEERGFSPAYQAGPQDRTALPQAGAQPTGGATLHPTPYSLHPNRIARASALLSGSTNRDPLNRPWSIAEYTFGDAVRRHEAQYAARAAAALAVGIEPPPYQPYITGLIHPGTPEHEEDQQMQQHSSEYWAAHFRKLIAERPDIQQALDEDEQAGEPGPPAEN